MREQVWGDIPVDHDWKKQVGLTDNMITRGHIRIWVISRSQMSETWPEAYHRHGLWEEGEE